MAAAFFLPYISSPRACALRLFRSGGRLSRCLEYIRNTSGAMYPAVSGRAVTLSRPWIAPLIAGPCHRAAAPPLPKTASRYNYRLFTAGPSERQLSRPLYIIQYGYIVNTISIYMILLIYMVIYMGMVIFRDSNIC